MKRIFCFLLVLTLFASCEKNITFNPSEPVFKYVIEGGLSNESGSCKVIISQTKIFKDNNQLNPVSGALVQIEHNGITYNLTEGSKGVYEQSQLKGVPGDTYKLLVVVSGENFSASSTMPQPVPFLDFTLQASDYKPSRVTPQIRFRDIDGIKNYYWFQQFINDKLQRQYKVFNDEFSSGQEISSYLVFAPYNQDHSEDIIKGDRLTAEMHCIDAAVYTYLYGLLNADGSGGGAASANPLSNISGGALGFFSAHTVERKSIVIP